MSDENAPLPSLRLKPRIRPEAVSTPPPSIVLSKTPLETIAAPPQPSVAVELPPADVSPTSPSAGRITLRMPVEAPAAEEHVSEPIVAPDLPIVPPPPGPLHANTHAPAAAVANGAGAVPFPDVSKLPIPTSPSAPASGGAETVEVGRFKLKPRLTAADASHAPAPSISGAAVAALPVNQPPPKSPNAPNMPLSTAPVAGAKPPPFLRAPQADAPPAAKVKERVKKSGGLRTGLLAGAIVLAVVVAVGGFLVLRHMMDLEKRPAASALAAKSQSAAAKSATASAAAKPSASADAAADNDKPVLKGGVVANPQSTAGKLVAKARDTLAAAEDAEKLPDLEEKPAEETEMKTTQLAIHPSSTAPAKATSTQVESNADLIRHDQPKAAPQPSAAFRLLVVNLRVNGVFQGDPARALMNGRMLRTGEVLDQQLGVRFTGVDSAHKLLIFEDSTGAIMQRRY
ncbi:MAG TPA: hypothetical protein VFT72_19860 [Opitutaceae bacterium]|nr:hypothetical protein [Opitutaceae bacterium]